MSTYLVEKRNYSRGTWRVVYAATGEQVWQFEQIDHPYLGRTTIPMPVCFNRKHDAVAWITEQGTS